MTTNTTTKRNASPALYCGTYAKYNNGSLEGAWLYLEDYADAEEFLEACHELHKDERDPELMFQDFMNFPRAFYCECMGQDSIQQIYDWIELDEHEREMLEAYEEIHGTEDGDISDRVQAASEAYFCTVDSKDWADVAMEYVESGCFSTPIPDALMPFFNWEVLGRDLKASMSMADNGMVFFD